MVWVFFRRGAICAAFALGVAGPVAAQEQLSGASVYRVELPGNPSTGYRWVLSSDSAAAGERVAVVALGYGKPETALIGAPAKYAIRLTCLVPGPVELVFDYLSPDGQRVARQSTVSVVCP